MHSRIYQLANKPISVDQYVAAEQLSTNTDICEIDYAEVSQTREYDLDCLTDLLPEGMFTLDREEVSLTYNGGFDEWTKKYIANIKTLDDEIPAANLFAWHNPRSILEKLLSNPLGISTLFVWTNAGWHETWTSKGLMEFIATLSPGDKLYIGQIFDYHF